ncbi:hypothetical protein GGR56DRAFT_666466 [Xylariaceae sp. FL0804]|nr:hypothetical protein GGR56DRAFT_666466 [Xylariaceae sp. FL0804]
MASPAVTLPNGAPASNKPTTAPANANAPTPMQIDEPASARPPTSSAKRKRGDGDGDVADARPNGLGRNGVSPSSAASAAAASASPASAFKIDNSTVRNYFTILQSYDSIPSVLKRPLPDADPAVEPDAKRKRPDDAHPLPSIADKVARDEYQSVDAIISDVKDSVSDLLGELRSAEPNKTNEANDTAVARTLDFKKKAHGLFRRELSYPEVGPVPDVLGELESTSDLQSNASGNMMLTVFGEAPRPRQLFSSLQQPVESKEGEATFHPLKEIGLPNGIKTAKAVPYFFPAAVNKDKKSKTLGELFPAPRNLQSLPPPKAPKSTTKGVQVGWHRPELTEKSKYRAGSYFGQQVSTGRWLDYSNAAPPSQIMTKQRERAMSLAGNKPCSSDLEMSEMEALFRGAFSSFAPSKDDSAAMVSSGLLSQTLWWQKVGQRNFDRLIGVDLPDGAEDESAMTNANPADEVDEEAIQKVIDDWDDSMIDPSLEDACCPKKSDEEKDVDDILQDVSDMIQTLISYQKNRNLTLPNATTQSRYAADPAHSDMLTTGTPVQPGDEETATYQVLKAQLVTVIAMLPPYAVARLNSDKLDELNISTKLEIRTDEYQGTMEEDETAARARAAQAAAANPRPPPQRTSSSSSTNLQYGQQFHASTSRSPMPNTPYYGAQTPVRPSQQPIRHPQTMPQPFPQRPPSNGGYRPPNSYANAAYTPQFAKAPTSYSQPGSYGATPTQNRGHYMPGYPNMGSQTPQARYPSYSHAPSTQPPAYHHQPYQPPHQQPGTPSHVPYGHYTNGVGAIPQRNASPHLAHQPPHHPQHAQHAQHAPHAPQGYQPHTPSRQPSYGGQPHMNNMNNMNVGQPRPHHPQAGASPMPHNQHPHPTPNINHAQQPAGAGYPPFHTSLNPLQVQQAMDQAKARFDAQKTAQRSNETMKTPGQGQAPNVQGHPGAPVGLGGIGLGSDPSRMAAARAGGMPGGLNYAAARTNNNNSPRLANGGGPSMAPAAATATTNGGGGPQPGGSREG